MTTATATGRRTFTIDGSSSGASLIPGETVAIWVSTIPSDDVHPSHTATGRLLRIEGVNDNHVDGRYFRGTVFINDVPREVTGLFNVHGDPTRHVIEEL